MNNNNNFEKKKLDGYLDTTKFVLRAERPNSKEKYSILKLYVNNFDNSEESGITIGYWTHEKNCEMFIPTSPSHWNLISEIFYITDVRYLPIQIGEETGCECHMETYCLDKHKKPDKYRNAVSIRELMGLPKIEKPSKYKLAIGSADNETGISDDECGTAIEN
ncbi:MAG: hypothetical protein K2M17_05935 [Bacilli bacterium]|nr:hypothetical protein [Bacilli bacterium]